MADMDLFGWPDASGLIRVVIRLGSAAILGGLIGLERERAGKAAGTRTHMGLWTCAASPSRKQRRSRKRSVHR